MKHKFAAILFLLFSGASYCLAQKRLQYDWLYSYVPFHGTYGTRMVPDGAGNTYIIVNNTNSYRDTIHGKSMNSNAYISRLLKIDKSGTLIWERIIQPERNKERKNEGAQPYLLDLAVSPKGDVLLIGNISGRVVFPSGKDSITKGCLMQRENIYDCMKGFILSYSESGKLNWINDLSYLEHSDRIGFNAKGELFLKVTYNRTLRIGNKSIDPVESEWRSPYHYSLLQLDLKGNFKRVLIRWEEIPWKSDSIPANRIENFDFTFDKKDNLIVYGQFAGSIRLSHAVTLYCKNKYYDSRALFVAKYSPDLKLLWQKKIGGRGTNSGSKLVKPAFNKKNEMYFAGSFHTECVISDGNSQSIPYEFKSCRSGAGFFYGKLNEQGDLQFVKYRLQPHDYTEVGVQAILLDDAGNTHILGSYNDSLQFAANGLVMFPGKKCETKTFDYEGKNLSYTHCEYQTCFYYSVWREDSLIHLQNLAEFKGYSHQQLAKSAFIKDNKLIFCGEYGLYEAYVESENGKLIVPPSKIGGGLLLAQVNLPNLDKDSIGEKSDSLTMAVNMEPDSLPNLNRIDENQLAENLLHQMDSLRPSKRETKNEKQMLKVYPNPFVAEFTLSVSQTLAEVELGLYDAAGQLIHSQMTEIIRVSEPLTLAFNNLAEGKYFLQVKAVNFKQILPLVHVN